MLLLLLLSPSQANNCSGEQELLSILRKQKVRCRGYEMNKAGSYFNRAVNCRDFITCGENTHRVARKEVFENGGRSEPFKGL
jgi:hypothetical protein